MSSQEQSNSVNKLQKCTGCYRTFPIELYLHNRTNKQFRTCVHCRTKQPKRSSKTEESNDFNNAEPVSQFNNFDEFLDFYLE